MKKITKSLLIILSGCIMTTSCRQGSPIEKALKDYVIKNAMGADIQYKSDKINIDTLTAGAIVDGYYAGFARIGNAHPKGTLVAYADSLKDMFKNDPSKQDYYKGASFLADRLSELDKKKPGEIAMYVVRNDYSIFNPLLKQRVNVSNIYLMDKDYHVLAEKSTDDLYQDTTDAAPMPPFENMYYHYTMVKE